MNAFNSKILNEEKVSLEKTLNSIRDDLAAARVAAMQILVFHLQAQTKEDDDVLPDHFMQAVSEVARANRALQQLEVTHLKAHAIDLPEALAKTVKKVTADLGELMRILERCSKSSEHGIRGFVAGANFYDLCCTRVAKGLNEVSGGLAAFFLEINEREKAEELERTSKIAQEIGKIGRVINMVATNASIEAARVGDAGKGFTVIADEVKTLSTRVSSLSVSLTNRLS